MLKLEPAGPRLGHPALSVGLVVVHPLVVPEGSTAYDIDDDEDDEDDNVDDGSLPPAALHARKDASLARVALEAKLALIVVPAVAVEITHNHRRSSVGAPQCLVNITVATR